MAYGLSFEQVCRIYRPSPVLQPWGRLTRCTEAPEYSLCQVELEPGGVQPLHFYPDGARHAFVEGGEVVVRRIDRHGEAQANALQPGSVLAIRPFEPHAFASRTGAMVYLFGPSGGGIDAIPVETLATAGRAMAMDRDLPAAGEPTIDRLEKYWGRIETVTSGDVAGKRIFVRKDGQSSLEFHLEKRETYWIHSGLLKVGLRLGRAENRSIVLRPGDGYDIRPGVMHMRIALEDTVIIEVSTRDSDADSHLVEDGQTYRHIEVPAG
jgi:mannose-6-phosphate isomerase-like protein (cupin superfamily)